MWHYGTDLEATRLVNSCSLQLSSCRFAPCLPCSSSLSDGTHHQTGAYQHLHAVCLLCLEALRALPEHLHNCCVPLCNEQPGSCWSASQQHHTELLKVGLKLQTHAIRLSGGATYKHSDGLQGPPESIKGCLQACDMLASLCRGRPGGLQSILCLLCTMIQLWSICQQ